MNDEPTIASLQQELSDARDRMENQERGMINALDDLHTARKTIKLAEEAYRQCDAKLKDALVEVEKLRHLLSGK